MKYNHKLVSSLFVASLLFGGCAYKSDFTCEAAKYGGTCGSAYNSALEVEADQYLKDKAEREGKVGEIDEKESKEPASEDLNNSKVKEISEKTEEISKAIVLMYKELEKQKEEKESIDKELKKTKQQLALSQSDYARLKISLEEKLEKNALSLTSVVLESSKTYTDKTISVAKEEIFEKINIQQKAITDRPTKSKPKPKRFKGISYKGGKYIVTCEGVSHSNLGDIIDIKKGTYTKFARLENGKKINLKCFRSLKKDEILTDRSNKKQIIPETKETQETQDENVTTIKSNTESKKII